MRVAYGTHISRMSITQTSYPWPPLLLLLRWTVRSGAKLPMAAAPTPAPADLSRSTPGAKLSPSLRGCLLAAGLLVHTHGDARLQRWRRLGNGAHTMSGHEWAHVQLAEAGEDATQHVSKNGHDHSTPVPRLAVARSMVRKLARTFACICVRRVSCSES